MRQKAGEAEFLFRLDRVSGHQGHLSPMAMAVQPIDQAVHHRQIAGVS